MKFEISTNKLINDIMSKEGGSAMLFAPKGSGKSEFLTALASRYRTVYWFSPATDDFEMFSLCLAKKILAGEENAEELYRVKQLIYAESEFNDETVILSHLMEVVQNRKTSTLIVLEQMESAPKAFDYKLIEWLIRQCPKNLVIVVSSERFINFDFNSFGENWPKLIEENLLNGKYLELIDMQEYLDGLSAEEVSLLHYITSMKSIEAAFVESFYKGGAKLLSVLASKGGYILPREEGTYRINGVLKDFLIGLNPEKRGDFWSEDLKTRLGNYCLENDDGHRALKTFILNGDSEGAVRALRQMFRTKKGNIKLMSFIQSCPEDEFLLKADSPFAKLYGMLRYYCVGDYKNALLTAEQLMSEFPEIVSQPAIRIRTVMFQSYVKLGEKEEAFRFRKKLFEEYSGNHVSLLDEIVCALPFLYRTFWGVPLETKQVQHYRKLVDAPESRQEIWYVRAKEAMTEAYLAAAQYASAIATAKEIRDYIPFYVIPHKLYSYYFYVFDIEETRALTQKALNYSFLKGIDTDRCLLYSALATVDHYYGKLSEAVEKLDLAAKEPNQRDYAKFSVIGKRCIYMARMERESYAREVATTYLKYAEVYNSEYVHVMNFAVAFCAFKQGDFDNAYYYAIRSVKASTAKDLYWLGAMAIATTCLLGKNGIEEPKTLIANIFRSAKNYKMEMILVELSDIIGVIMDFARANQIEPEFIREVDAKIAMRNGLHDETKNVNVKFFGISSVRANHTELLWKTKKSKDLFLHYLLAGDQGMDRAIIIDLLWNGYMYDSAINNLKTTNNIIRKTLKEAGLDFSLDYLNGKYILRLKNYNSDYDRYQNLLKSLKAEDNPTKKMMILDEIFMNYGQDFATDMSNYDDIRGLQKEIEQQKIIATITVIKSLARSGNFVDAKRFIAKLEVLDPDSDYREMRKEIDGKINILNENE